MKKIKRVDNDLIILIGVDYNRPSPRLRPELNICYSIKYIAINLTGQRWSVRPVSRLTVDLDFLLIPENIHQGH